MIAAVLADAMEAVIGTVIHSSDRYLFRFKAITHPSRQVFIGGFVEITTADAGLVGDDNDQPAQLVGPEASQFENSRDELELVRPVNVATININHAVAVKKIALLVAANLSGSVMPKVQFLGRTLPATAVVNTTDLPKTNWKMPDLDLDMTFTVRIVNSIISVDIEINKCDKDEHLVQVYMRALDIARGAVDLCSFRDAIGLTVVLET